MEVIEEMVRALDTETRGGMRGEVEAHVGELVIKRYVLDLLRINQEILMVRGLQFPQLGKKGRSRVLVMMQRLTSFNLN